MVPDSAAGEVASAGAAAGADAGGVGSCSIPSPSIAAVNPPIGFLAIHDLRKCGNPYLCIYVIKELADFVRSLAGRIDLLDGATVRHGACIVDPIVHDCR